MEPAAHMHFPWRPLGELLVEERLLTHDELEQALAEQARSGRLLGQILVSNGYLTAFSLARVLSEQHGVELHRGPETDAPVPVTEFSLADPPEFGAAPTEYDEQHWRPLGKVLVDHGFVTEAQLAQALAEQRHGGGRLGEILVSRGFLSGAELARALTEQHGVTFEPEAGLEVVIRSAEVDEPMYRVFDVTFEPGFQQRSELYASANFLEAADYAFEYVEDRAPEALEIHRTHGAAQETVWHYSADRAAAASAARPRLVDTFGFDPTKWGKKL